MCREAKFLREQLGEANGILILDPSSFPKSGSESVGVARQWCGRLGKVDNCQVGLYLAYASGKGHALVDGELYLPKEWTNNKKRMKQAGIPENKRRYKTRHETFLEMLKLHGPELPIPANNAFLRFAQVFKYPNGQRAKRKINGSASMSVTRRKAR